MHVGTEAAEIATHENGLPLLGRGAGIGGPDVRQFNGREHLIHHDPELGEIGPERVRVQPVIESRL